MSDSINEAGYPEEWQSYEPPSNLIRSPEPKEYTFTRVTDEGTFKCGVWYQDPVTGKKVPSTSPNAQPVAWFNFRGQISGGEHDGRIAFGGCGTQTSKYRKGTTVQDFILASKSGLRPTSSQLVNEILQEKPSTLERITGPFNARTIWEWRCCDETFMRGTTKSAKSPKKYDGDKVIAAKDADNRVSHVQKCPSCKTEKAATLVITDFVVPKDKIVDGPQRQTAPVGLPPSAA